MDTAVVAPRGEPVADCRTAMDIVAVNPGETLFVSGDIEDWDTIRRMRIGVVVGLSGRQALDDLRRRRPGALFNAAFAAHVEALPPRRINVETL